jgi:hypothetical protein
MTRKVGLYISLLLIALTRNTARGTSRRLLLDASKAGTVGLLPHLLMRLLSVVLRVLQGWVGRPPALWLFRLGLWRLRLAR